MKVRRHLRIGHDEGVERFSGEIEKGEDEFWVSYAGTIGTSYDIRTMVLAGKELLKRGKSSHVIWRDLTVDQIIIPFLLQQLRQILRGDTMALYPPQIQIGR